MTGVIIKAWSRVAPEWRVLSLALTTPILREAIREVAKMSRGIYFVEDRISSAIKIGYSQDVEQRIRELQTGNPNELKLIAIWHNATLQDEVQLHNLLESHRIQNEWFSAYRIKNFLRWFAYHIPAIVLYDLAEPQPKEAKSNLLSRVVRRISSDGRSKPEQLADILRKYPDIRFDNEGNAKSYSQILLDHRVTQITTSKGTLSAAFRLLDGE